MASLVAEQDAFLRDVVKLLAKAWELGFVVTGGELWRTPEQQKVYVQTGRSMTMNSRHLDRLAVDFNFFANGVLVSGPMAVSVLRPLGEYWESLSPKNRWGGNFDRDFNRKDPFVDCPHFERKP